MKTPLVSFSLATILMLTLSGCGGNSNNLSVDDSGYDFDSTDNYNPTLAPIFDPANGLLPTQNNVLFASTADGTLNIPVDNLSGGQLALATAMNTLDGFALTAPFTADFTDKIDPSSVILGDSVHVIKMTQENGAVTAATALTSSEMMVTVSADQMSLIFVPLKPLDEASTYAVAVTNSLKDTDGVAAGMPTTYALTKSTTALVGDAAALEPLRMLTVTAEAAASQVGVNSADIILSWQFNTQSVTPVQDAMVAQATAQSLAMANTTLNTQQANPALQGLADIYAGTLTVPYYLGADAAALSSYWQGAGDSHLTRYNPTPVKKSDQTIPVLMTVPNATSGKTQPAAGWPVVMFQHGITRDRTDLLAIADSLAAAGFAAIAIDLPLHGITDNTNGFYQAGKERTFDLDLQNNATELPGPDGTIDASGGYFINLSSLLTSRDNFRQGVSDLLVLRNSLGNITDVTLDTDQVGFVGISLGGMVGTSYLAAETKVTPASIVVAGGGIARLLDASNTFGDRIRAGLAAAGVTAGTPAYDTFMTTTQWVVDPADPITLASKVTTNNHPLHFIEVIGDDVVPNAVSTAPMSGTEPLINALGLSALSTAGQHPANGAVRFIAGDHGSLLNPTTSAAATIEMQTQVAAFQAAQGLAITINNASLLQQ